MAFSATSVKKTQVQTTTINGISYDMRVKWNTEYQEYSYNIKLTGERTYNEDTTGFTNDYLDAIGSVHAMLTHLSRQVTTEREAALMA